MHTTHLTQDRNTSQFANSEFQNLAETVNLVFGTLRIFGEFLVLLQKACLEIEMAWEIRMQSANARPGKLRVLTDLLGKWYSMIMRKKGFFTLDGFDFGFENPNHRNHRDSISWWWEKEGKSWPTRLCVLGLRKDDSSELVAYTYPSPPPHARTWTLYRLEDY